MTTPLFTLQETRDYSEFSYYSFNRNIDKKKVARLKKSIQETTQIISPIVTDPDGKILEGQHRLEALKELKMPVWYVIRRSPGKVIKELIEANNIVDKWKQYDFCSAFAETGNNEYQSIIEVHNYWEKKLNRTLPFGRIVYAYTNAEGKKFKEGLATFFKDRGNKIMSILFELDKLYEDKMAFHFNNIRSLKNLIIRNKQFDTNHFIEQCKKKKFNTYSTVQDTTDSMISVYNYHVLNPSKKIR
mgnify:FL=1